MFLKIYPNILKQGDWIFNFNMCFFSLCLTADVFPVPVTEPLYLMSCPGSYLTRSHIGLSDYVTFAYEMF